MLLKFHAPEVLFGIGSLAEAGYAAVRLGARRPMVVTDPGLIEAGWPAELKGHLVEVGLVPHLWHDVTPNPKDREIRRGYAAYQEHGCDVLIALGGGSCLDAAKGVAVLAGNGGDILDYRGVDKMTSAIPPLIAIPATSGTGADVSQFCIVTDTVRSVKVTIMSRALVPDLSITDPRLLTTMPDWLNAATGLDALTHAIEAFVSRAHNPLTDIHALNAAQLVMANLRAAMERGASQDVRERMALASLDAGLAFSNAILGATHAMSHQVGGLLDAPHGVINGVLLPHVIRYNAATAADRFRDLAVATQVCPPQTPAAEAAELLALRVRALADEVGVPAGLASLGVTVGDCESLAESTFSDACLTTNPRKAERREIAAIFQAAL
ncbi:MAG: iron-containing alcohol dehydrogenase [Austwickia sp.]|nr:iron-containing alcohol dehydrogenase [Austwickia sp.]MBK8437878.1 iron-containing alcohol dehydrogenase [Austwickia sp.]MBK9100179.1 iron-containing alcohol dehydrogenase [Austwickia sp.]